MHGGRLEIHPWYTPSLSLPTGEGWLYYNGRSGNDWDLSDQEFLDMSFSTALRDYFHTIYYLFPLPEILSWLFTCLQSHSMMIPTPRTEGSPRGTNYIFFRQMKSVSRPRPQPQ